MTATTYHPWATFSAAREEARRVGDRRMGTDHLLLGLLHDPTIERVVGVTLDQARSALTELDNAALESVGIAVIVPEPTRTPVVTPERPSVHYLVEHRMKMSPAAKATLRSASRPMRHGEHITSLDVLAAIAALRAPDPALTLLGALGVDVVALRARINDAKA